MEHVAPVDDDQLAGHEGRVVGCEEDHAANEVLGNLCPSKRARPDTALRRFGAVLARAAGVSVKPGAIELTRMPCGPSSLARARVRPMTAPLDAE